MELVKTKVLPYPLTRGFLQGMYDKVLRDEAMSRDGFLCIIAKYEAIDRGLPYGPFRDTIHLLLLDEDILTGGDGFEPEFLPQHLKHEEYANIRCPTTWSNMHRLEFLKALMCLPYDEGREGQT